MEYTTIYPMLSIVLPFFIGIMIGGVWCYINMEKDIQDIKKELDAKNRELEIYTKNFKNKYDYEEYDAY